tara:strand:+ start:106 stop:426 length:321 start_codon:yes stop_codon:yes gene_type:complete
MKDTKDMSHDHVDPLFRNILNAVSGQMEAITAMRSDIKLKHMPDTQRLTVQQAEALNKLLDLIHDLMHEVDDQRRQDKYERRFQLILDRLFPERKQWRNTEADGTK